MESTNFNIHTQPRKIDFYNYEKNCLILTLNLLVEKGVQSLNFSYTGYEVSLPRKAGKATSPLHYL